MTELDKNRSMHAPEFGLICSIAKLAPVINASVLIFVHLATGSINNQRRQDYVDKKNVAASCIYVYKNIFF